MLHWLHSARFGASSAWVQLMFRRVGKRQRQHLSSWSANITHLTRPQAPRLLNPSNFSIRSVPILPFVSVRCMAKKSKSGGKKSGNDDSSESAASVRQAFDTSEYDSLMDKSVVAMKKEFDKIRTGQASASMLDHVKVEAYGSHTPLSQVGQVGLRDAKTIVVSVFDPTVIKDVEAAIRDCGMNLNPIVEDKLIRVPIPKMTKELREGLAKTVKDIGENSKLSVRRARTKGMDSIKKISKSLSKDDVKAYEKEIQEYHDKHVKDIDDLIQRKVKAIMT